MPNETYTATITLKAKASYTFTGVDKNFFTVSGATATNSANSGEVTVKFPKTAATITTKAIGLTAPVAGATRVTSITATQYSGTVTWNPTVSSTFAPSTDYTATINLTAKSGYTLVGVSENFFTVDGATTETNFANSGTVIVTFPKTATTITTSAITGLTAPVTGEEPVEKIDDTDQYTGTVKWSPEVSGTFAQNTTYTAIITLSPKAGYTLAGVGTNFFEVAGATTTNPADSGIVKAEFPKNLSFPLGMILVPAGNFQRDEGSGNISIITKPYYMSQYQITRAQFKAVMGEDPSDLSRTTGENDPVQNVNWYHAIAFCNKLSIKEGKDPVYSVKVSGTEVDWANLTFASIPTSSDSNWDAATQDPDKNGYRLPTEMEWMWAAMGAPADGQGGEPNTTGYLKKFAGSNGSNSIGDYAWYSTNANGKTHPVGTKAANELGIFDLSGNVWEWCWDWYASSYPSGTKEDYEGAASGAYRVSRGGSWYFSASYCTFAYRNCYNPHVRHYNYGFRVVCP